MEIVSGSSNNFEILDVTYRFLTFDMIENCGITFNEIKAQLIVCSEGDSKMFKGTNQIMSSRFTNVHSLALIPRVSI